MFENFPKKPFNTHKYYTNALYLQVQFQPNPRLYSENKTNRTKTNQTGYGYGRKFPKYPWVHSHASFSPPKQNFKSPRKLSHSNAYIIPPKH